MPVKEWTEGKKVEKFCHGCHEKKTVVRLRGSTCVGCLCEDCFNWAPVGFVDEELLVKSEKTKELKNEKRNADLPAGAGASDGSSHLGSAGDSA